LVYSEELYVELSPRSIAFHKERGYGQPPAPSLHAALRLEFKDEAGRNMFSNHHLEIFEFRAGVNLR